MDLLYSYLYNCKRKIRKGQSCVVDKYSLLNTSYCIKIEKAKESKNLDLF